MRVTSPVVEFDSWNSGIGPAGPVTLTWPPPKGLAWGYLEALHLAQLERTGRWVSSLSGQGGQEQLSVGPWREYFCVPDTQLLTHRKHVPATQLFTTVVQRRLLDWSGRVPNNMTRDLFLAGTVVAPVVPFVPVSYAPGVPTKANSWAILAADAEAFGTLDISGSFPYPTPLPAYFPFADTTWLDFVQAAGYPTEPQVNLPEVLGARLHTGGIPQDILKAQHDILDQIFCYCCASEPSITRTGKLMPDDYPRVNYQDFNSFYTTLLGQSDTSWIPGMAYLHRPANRAYIYVHPMFDYGVPESTWAGALMRYVPGEVFSVPVIDDTYTAHVSIYGLIRGGATVFSVSGDAWAEGGIESAQIPLNWPSGMGDGRFILLGDGLVGPEGGTVEYNGALEPLYDAAVLNVAPSATPPWPPGTSSWLVNAGDMYDARWDLAAVYMIVDFSCEGGFKMLTRP